MSVNIYQLRELSPMFHVTHVISVYNITFDEKYQAKGESHNFWELVYVADGVLGVTANDQILELQKGQIIFHKPGEFHRLWSEKESKPTVFIFTFSLDCRLKKLEHMLCSLSDKELELMKDLREVTSSFETLVDDETTIMHIECQDESTYALNHEVKNYIELLIIHIIRNHQKLDEVVIQKGASHTHYQKITSYIQANLFHKINIDMICENCNISQTTLKNIFRKYVGISAMEYVNQLKIQASIPLLEQGMTHQEIADRLAFSSQYYFSTVFKRVMGTCPNRFKRSC